MNFFAKKVAFLPEETGVLLRDQEEGSGKSATTVTGDCSRPLLILCEKKSVRGKRRPLLFLLFKKKTIFSPLFYEKSALSFFIITAAKT